MKTTYDLGIVIPCKNEAARITHLLDSLHQQTLVDTQTPIIIADAHSDDGTRELIEAYRQRTRLNIRIIDGGLPPTGRNLGARQLDTGYLLFLDADIVLGEPETLEKVYRVVQRRQLDLAVTDIRCENAGAFDRFFWGGFGFMARAKVLGPVVTGMFVFIRREAFWQAGGFHEDMLLGDDVELGRRIHKSKFALVPTWIYTSNRRFVKDGYLKTVISYVQVFFSRQQRMKRRTEYFGMGY